MYDLMADWPRLEEAFEQAPSIFNTKPWSFKPLPPERVELRLPGRSEMDKWLERESVISCGAALYNLRVAIRAAGHDLEVWLIPKPHDQELLASVEIVIGRIKKPARWEQELYEAIPQRHTNRWPYIIPAPLPIIAEMEEAASEEGAHLRLLHPRQARKWMRQTAEVDKKFTAHFPNHVAHANCGPRPKNHYRVTRREFWLDEERRFEHKPQLMALSTADDQPVDWLRAGQALQRALLTGIRYSLSKPYGQTALYHAPPQHGLPAHHHLLTGHGHDDKARHGLSMSFLTQSLEYDDFKDKPRHWPWRWPFPELPQMIMRVGYAQVEVPGEP